MRNRYFFLTAMGVCLVLAAFVSPYASESPDGLEKVAAQGGFAPMEKESSARSLALFAGYTFPAPWGGKGAAGIFGALLAAAAGYGVGKFITRKSAAASTDNRG
ncbi:MAG: PDGLE domain-containing protein [Nitrospinae bacterium]|nr:PDGLE domain-containing protein [Nitrospinota bacterium]